MLQCVLHPLLPVIFGPRGSHVLIRDRSLNFTEAPAQGSPSGRGRTRGVPRAVCSLAPVGPLRLHAHFLGGMNAAFAPSTRTSRIPTDLYPTSGGNDGTKIGDHLKAKGPRDLRLGVLSSECTAMLDCDAAANWRYSLGLTRQRVCRPRTCVWGLDTHLTTCKNVRAQCTYIEAHAHGMLHNDQNRLTGSSALHALACLL